MTAIGHPSLRGRLAPRSATRRWYSLPGEATGASILLAAVVTVLNMFGLVMVMSAASVISVREGGPPWSYAQRQVVWTVVGCLALVATSWISIDFWRRHVRVWLFTTIGMLVAVLIPGIGITVNGATRWIGVGPLQLQPSELAKFALLLFCADLLDRSVKAALTALGGWVWDFSGDIPYFGMLSLADTIVVTQDSVSMISEASATSVPVMVAPLPGKSRRQGLFLKTMLDEDRVRLFDGRFAAWTVAPLNDTPLAAAEMKRRLGL